MSDLSSQLSSIFEAGLRSDPSLAQGLADALSSGSFGGKETKAEANYRKAETDGESCGECKYFSPDGGGTCDVVAGTISTDHVSDRFAPRRGNDRGDSGVSSAEPDRVGASADGSPGSSDGSSDYSS